MSNKNWTLMVPYLLWMFSHILKIYPGQSKLSHLSYRFCTYNYIWRFSVETTITIFRTANKVVRTYILTLRLIAGRKYYLVVATTTLSLICEFGDSSVKFKNIISLKIVISRRFRQWYKRQPFISIIIAEPSEFFCDNIKIIVCTKQITFFLLHTIAQIGNLFQSIMTYRT